MKLSSLILFKLLNRDMLCANLHKHMQYQRQKYTACALEPTYLCLSLRKLSVKRATSSAFKDLKMGE